MQRFRPMEPLKSLDRALALLDELLDEHAPPAPAASFSVSELARRLHVDKSTVSRIAATLEGRGYLQRDPVSRRYQLGPKIQPPTPWHDHAHHLRTLAHPVLERLVDKTGECAHIALLVGDRALIIEDLEAKSRGLQVRAGVGRTMPLHCTALGKAFLAFTPTPIPDVLHHERNERSRGELPSTSTSTRFAFRATPSTTSRTRRAYVASQPPSATRAARPSPPSVSPPRSFASTMTASNCSPPPSSVRPPHARDSSATSLHRWARLLAPHSADVALTGLLTEP